MEDVPEILLKALLEIKFPCGIEPCYKKKNRSIPPYANRRRSKENETDHKAIRCDGSHSFYCTQQKTRSSRRVSLRDTAREETEFRVQK